ncbi:response regulator transcription factor [Lentzea sp. NPDC004782]|uniref:response regulator transcription factor n=1 Tax=Lentzea sp. NPDC004782 TaxID=3154458 RepID=UPI0033A29DF0
MLLIHDHRCAPPAVGDLLRAAGMHVKVVPLGEQVLNHVRAHLPDVVVLTAGGPESAGAFLRTLRTLSARPAILLLADGCGPAELCLADDFVLSGEAPGELLLRVEVLVARRALPATGTTLRAGPVSIDTDARQVRVNERWVSLTTTEFELLCLLVRNAGRVVTKSAILDHVWRYDFQGESNIVETYICSLRRKLADADRSVIRTIRGSGYLFAVDDCRERLSG